MQIVTISYFISSFLLNLGQGPPVLEIGLGPLTADFGSVWSSEKAHKFQHIQRTTKRVFCVLTP